MSRVQLALNVSDLDAGGRLLLQAVRTEPAKRRPGYANFAIAEPPLKLVLIEGPGAAGHAEPPRRRGRVAPTRSAAATARLAAEGLADRHRGPGVVLLRAAGQGVGRRARR